VPAVNPHVQSLTTVYTTYTGTSAFGLCFCWVT